MRSLVLVLAALLVAAAAWLLTGNDPSSPSAAHHENALVEPSSPQPRATPTAARAAGSAGDAATIAPDSRLAAPAPASPSESEPPAVPAAEFVVVDEAGRPIELARVQAFAGERDFTTAWTDERGVATLRGAPPDAKYRVRADGYWPFVGDGCVASTTTRIVMRRASLLTGTVFDTAGAPVAGAHAYLMPVVPGRLSANVENLLMLSPDLHPWTAVTDAGGHFERRWPDDDAYDLVVVAKGFAQAVVPALSVGGQGEAPVIVCLQPAATVTGVALRGDGVPLVNVMVQVATVRAGQPSGVAVLGPPSWQRADQPLGHATTRARGEFSIDDLPAGPVVVTLANPHAAASVFTTLVAGRTTQVQLRADQTARIDGEVQHAQAETVSVFLYGGPTALRQGSTLGGEFVFDDVPPGRYLVGAVRKDLGTQVAAIVQDFIVNGATSLATTVDLAPGEQRHVVLPSPVPANGGVSGSASVGGSPASGCVVWLDPLSGTATSRREGMVDAGGEFRIESVPLGDYDARLHKFGDPKVLVEVRCRVRAGDTVPITLAAP